MKFEWQEIFCNADDSERTLRAKVIGGWLVKHLTWSPESHHGTIPVATTMVFVADADHMWKVDA